VIDLRGANHSGLVKIIDTRSDRSTERAVYAALSYCWGGDQAVKTTLATVNRHLAGIRIAQLGQTLQDAIKVARSLGICFLWVDSLCIVQDDLADVAAEISRMSTYFESCYVSISATVAASSNQGFLAPRNDPVFRHGPFELPYRGPDKRLGSIKLATYFKYSSDAEPVTSRAWVMQESLLAPRLLSYGYQNLTFSCRTCNRSDGGPYQEWHDFRDRVNWAKLQSDVHLPTDISYPIEKWKDLVKSYTERALTVSNDKLAAISGIAQKYTQILIRYLHEDAYQMKKGLPNNDSLTREDFVLDKKFQAPYYAAGLWYFRIGNSPGPYRFREQLLWTTSFGKFYDSDDPNPVSGTSYPNRSLNYRAPSWFWAAVDGPVIYEGWERYCYLDVTECRVDPYISTAPYVAVRAGHLTVRGEVREATHATQSGHFRVVYRPDTASDDLELSQVIDGVRIGWLLRVPGGGIFDKPKYPNWNPQTPKGLALVKDGIYYRRIGLFSLEQGNHQQNLNRSGFRSDWKSQVMTII
jgi:hypothetical protein